ncbi:MAG: hypothetical protein H6740_16435 [Alphaproteobacteria bacterium]|nr:hypothetical protein [Alphaproteobacteria bacterium]
MPHRSDDHEAILFRSPELTIRRCACGVVHLDIGPVSIRLEDEGFEAFTRACRQATARLALRHWELAGSGLTGPVGATEH